MVFIFPYYYNNCHFHLAYCHNSNLFYLVSIIILIAAGYQTVIVESVGIGQSEVFIGNLVDCLLYLQVPGGGDELQAMKKGIIELADLIIVNKADLADSMNTIFQLKSALGLSSFTTASINKSFNEMKFTSNPKYKNKEKDDGNEAMKKGNEFESKYQKVLAVSAKTGQGMNQVLNEIDSFVSHQKVGIIININFIIVLFSFLSL